MINVGEPANQPNAGGHFLQQRDRPSQRTHRILRILRLFKPHGRIGAILDLGGRLAMVALKFAASKRIRVVPGPIALASPPITPAIPIGPPPSAITVFEESSSYSSLF